jgi:hypothetical protein
MPSEFNKLNCLNAAVCLTCHFLFNVAYRSIVAESIQLSSSTWRVDEVAVGCFIYLNESCNQGFKFYSAFFSQLFEGFIRTEKFNLN